MEWFKQPINETLLTIGRYGFTPERPAPEAHMYYEARAIIAGGVTHLWTERKLAEVWGTTRHTVRRIKDTVGWPEAEKTPLNQNPPLSRHQANQPAQQNQVVTVEFQPDFAKTQPDSTKTQPLTRARSSGEIRSEESRSLSDGGSEPTPAPKAEQRRRGFFTAPRDLPPEPIQVDLSKPERLPPHQRINLAWNDSLIAAGIRSRYITREINTTVDSRLTEDPEETCRLIPIFIRLATTTAGGWIRAPAPRWDAFAERWAGELSAWDGDENHAPGCGRKLDEVRRGRDNRSPIEREQAIAAHEPEDPDWHLRELPWTTDPPAGTATPLPRTTSHTALRPV